MEFATGYVTVGKWIFQSIALYSTMVDDEVRLPSTVQLATILTQQGVGTLTPLVAWGGDPVTQPETYLRKKCYHNIYELIIKLNANKLLS